MDFLLHGHEVATAMLRYCALQLILFAGRFKKSQMVMALQSTLHYSRLNRAAGVATKNG